MERKKIKTNLVSGLRRQIQSNNHQITTEESQFLSSSKKIKRDTIDKTKARSILKAVANEFKSAVSFSLEEFRQEEHDKILTFIQNNFNSKGRGKAKEELESVMIIFGQPGLGKTQLMYQLLDRFNKPQKQAKRKQKKQNKFFYYNAMNYDDGNDLLIDILNELLYEYEWFEKSRDAGYILQVFRKNVKKVVKKNNIGVLIDELDHLYDKNPNRFNTLMEFLNMSQKGFVKIGVSNKLDFIGVVSGMKIVLKMNFLVFKPYTMKELKSIIVTKLKRAIKDRLSDLDLLISPVAIDMIAKKTMKNKSSDVRCINRYIIDLAHAKRDLIKESYKKEKEISLCDFSIGVKDLLKNLDFKGNDGVSSIITKLSFPHQIYILSLYQLISEDRFSVSECDMEKRFNKNLKLFELEPIELKNEFLSILIGYNFIKKEKVKNERMIKSVFSRSVLSKQLLTVDGFADILD